MNDRAKAAWETWAHHREETTTYRRDVDGHDAAMFMFGFIAAETAEPVKTERQRIRAILWGLEMLHKEAPDEQSQRRITHFVSRVDELISELVPLPPELAEKVKQWWCSSTPK